MLTLPVWQPSVVTSDHPGAGHAVHHAAVVRPVVDQPDNIGTIDNKLGKVMS